MAKGRRKRSESLDDIFKKGQAASIGRGTRRSEELAGPSGVFTGGKRRKGVPLRSGLSDAQFGRFEAKLPGAGGSMRKAPRRGADAMTHRENRISGWG